MLFASIDQQGLRLKLFQSCSGALQKEGLALIVPGRSTLDRDDGGVFGITLKNPFVRALVAKVERRDDLHPGLLPVASAPAGAICVEELQNQRVVTPDRKVRRDHGAPAERRELLHVG